MMRRKTSPFHWPVTAAIGLLALACALHAGDDKKDKTTDTNSVPLIAGYIEKFEIPERDGKGNLRTVFKGDRATFLPDGQMDVLNLRAEFYTSNRVSMAISAASCRVDQHNKKGSTDSDLRLERDDLIVTGTGADWDDAQKIINIHSNVHVTLTGGAFTLDATKPNKKTP